MMVRKVPTLKQARQAALQGKAEEAIPLLRVHANGGDSSASASLAELLAFKDEWQECLHRTGELIAKPQSVYAGNVFSDMIRLLARSGQETKQWDLLCQVTQAAEQRVEENIAGYTPVKQEAQRVRYGKIFQSLRAYAQSKGSFPHELIQVFGTVGPTQTERDFAYQAATQNVLQQRPDLRDNPNALSSHYFSLAQSYRQEAEGIRLYEEGRMPAHFDFAVFVAKAYIRREKPEGAWEILWKHMSLWWPVDNAQIAPVILIVDRDLIGVMNHERCEKVLSLPRGPEAHDDAR